MVTLTDDSEWPASTAQMSPSAPSERIPQRKFLLVSNKKLFWQNAMHVEKKLD